MSAIQIRTVDSKELSRHIEQLAELRIRVFREYPYLYDGSEASERDYLQSYLDSGKSMAVLAQVGTEIVGVSTGIPMAHETDELKEPFRSRGDDLGTIFYCGESVLLPEYRGRGIYRSFFEGRESFARSLGGFETTCFCGVIRPRNHPARPFDFVPLDEVWRHFGYTKADGPVARFSWKEIGETSESLHTMQFWMKPLTSGAPPTS